MKFYKKNLRTFIFFSLRAVALLSRFLSWQIGIRLGGAIGTLLFFLLRRERARSRESLQAAFGAGRSERELNDIIKKSFQHLGKGLIEILNFQTLTEPEINALVEIDGEEYLKSAEAEGNGTILITGHTGNWELMAAALSLRGYPMRLIAPPLYDPRIDEWIVRLRARFEVETISRGTPSSSKKILEVLQKNEILGLLIDPEMQNGVPLNFFNKKAYTPGGAAQIALRSGAATLICFVTRLPNNRHRITIEKPMALTLTDDLQKNIEVNTARLTSRIEEHIKQYPDQWVWMHRRWKTKPEDRSE
ncbi:MAG TPA: lysophospholipid acyltransferase family protein [Candidatus Manganitrophaceae bacterium]|nr:lysophospholipid acyltransferase family protein [Candidatus Manganitrophaceae bacterium]